MFCNLSVSESLLLRGALAFSACTWLLDPLSLGRLWRYGGSGFSATGGAETAVVGSATDWQLASVWRYTAQVVHLASCHWMALTISCARKQAVERVPHLKQFR